MYLGVDFFGVVVFVGLQVVDAVGKLGACALALLARRHPLAALAARRHFFVDGDHLLHVLQRESPVFTNRPTDRKRHRVDGVKRLAHSVEVFRLVFSGMGRSKKHGLRQCTRKHDTHADDALLHCLRGEAAVFFRVRLLQRAGRHHVFQEHNAHVGVVLQQRQHALGVQRWVSVLLDDGEHLFGGRIGGGVGSKWAWWCACAHGLEIGASCRCGAARKTTTSNRNQPDACRRVTFRPTLNALTLRMCSQHRKMTSWLFSYSSSQRYLHTE